uniref:Uncharacterized protein n=1 Tax=Picea glauca TaxID=3330 RepID=A0A101LZV4_PICGL|nr:hypothetical protein ABT39_MTgene5268 [Picea glauca]QHR88804.1 hypothetical protein Q903MT_gene2820 [Picea sitchensis]
MVQGWFLETGNEFRILLSYCDSEAIERHLLLTLAFFLTSPKLSLGECLPFKYRLLQNPSYDKRDWTTDDGWGCTSLQLQVSLAVPLIPLFVLQETHILACISEPISVLAKAPIPEYSPAFLANKRRGNEPTLRRLVIKGPLCRLCSGIFSSIARGFLRLSAASLPAYPTDMKERISYP